MIVVVAVRVVVGGATATAVAAQAPRPWNGVTITLPLVLLRGHLKILTNYLVLLLLAIESQQSVGSIHDGYAAYGQRYFQFHLPMEFRWIHNYLNRIVNTNGTCRLHRCRRYRGQIQIAPVHLSRPAQHVAELF